MKTDINVKICGLTRPRDVETAIRFGAGFLGFIVEAKSKRRLSTPQAARLALPARGIVPTVAVTVNADDDLLRRIMQQMSPDYIQCHGDETPGRLRDIRHRFNVKTVKAISVSGPDDLRALTDYEADLVLLDAKAPEGTPRGGHGTAFDWGMLKNARLPQAWMLAGGLNPQNARKAVKQTKAQILDVSSGVERSPGIKDPAKIKALIDMVRYG